MGLSQPSSTAHEQTKFSGSNLGLGRLTNLSLPASLARHRPYKKACFDFRNIIKEEEGILAVGFPRSNMRRSHKKVNTHTERRPRRARHRHFRDNIVTSRGLALLKSQNWIESGKAYRLELCKEHHPRLSSFQMSVLQT